MDRNYINGSIRGRSARLLIDTGAGVSCVSYEFLHSIGYKYRDLGQTQVFNRVRGVGGETHDIIGTIDLTVSISGFKVKQMFHVFKHMYTL